MIDGVSVRPLRQIKDERGSVMHMLRHDDPWFQEFGEIYFSTIVPGVVKGWHLHKQMTLNYAVVSGRIRLALYDERESSPTAGTYQEVLLGGDNYALVTIPPGVWNGFEALDGLSAIVANCSTEPHDPQEIIREDPFTPRIPNRWEGRTGR